MLRAFFYSISRHDIYITAASLDGNEEELDGARHLKHLLSI